MSRLNNEMKNVARELGDVPRFRWKKWLFVGVGVFLLLYGIFFVLGILTRPLNTLSGIADRTLNSDNVIVKYEQFHDWNQAILAKKNQIAGHKEVYQEVPQSDSAERSRVRIELAAMKQSCRNLVTNYNSNSEKINTSIFKGWSLPHNISLQECE